MSKKLSHTTIYESYKQASAEATTTPRDREAFIKAYAEAVSKNPELTSFDLIADLTERAIAKGETEESILTLIGINNKAVNCAILYKTIQAAIGKPAKRALSFIKKIAHTTPEVFSEPEIRRIFRMARINEEASVFGALFNKAPQYTPLIWDLLLENGPHVSSKTTPNFVSNVIFYLYQVKDKDEQVRQHNYLLPMASKDDLSIYIREGIVGGLSRLYWHYYQEDNRFFSPDTTAQFLALAGDPSPLLSKFGLESLEKTIKANIKERLIKNKANMVRSLFGLSNSNADPQKLYELISLAKHSWGTDKLVREWENHFLDLTKLRRFDKITQCSYFADSLFEYADLRPVRRPAIIREINSRLKKPDCDLDTELTLKLLLAQQAPRNLLFPRLVGLAVQRDNKLARRVLHTTAEKDKTCAKQILHYLATNHNSHTSTPALREEILDRQPSLAGSIRPKSRMRSLAEKLGKIPQ